MIPGDNTKAKRKGRTAGEVLSLNIKVAGKKSVAAMALALSVEDDEDMQIYSFKSIGNCSTKERKYNVASSLHVVIFTQAQ